MAEKAQLRAYKDRAEVNLLEQNKMFYEKVKELIDRVESLHTQVYYHPEKAVPKKYWPNTNPPYKYDGVMWNPPEYN